MLPETWETLKSNLATLDAADRRKVIAYLITLGNDTAHRDWVAKKIDDHDPSHWIPGEELGWRLGLEEPPK